MFNNCFHTLLMIHLSFQIFFFLQTSYLRVVSGAHDNLESVSKL